MKMKKFIAPTLELVKLNTSDIIATSGDFVMSDEEVLGGDILSRPVDGDWSLWEE